MEICGRAFIHLLVLANQYPALLLRMNLSPPSPVLTAHQERVYRFLEQQHGTTGLMPSVREIQHHFRFASQNQAVVVLRALEKKGRDRPASSESAWTVADPTT